MLEVFYIGSIFCALVTVYVLIFKENALPTYADILLSLFFIINIWCILIYLSIYYGWIVTVPHLYKTAAPLNFLLAPVTYLYTRAILFNEKKTKPTDLLHLVPFIIFLINYIPFYILPADKKSLIVNTTRADFNNTIKLQVGLFPEYISQLFRIIQIIIYAIFQWSLIIKFKKENKNIEIEKQIKDVIKWLKLFAWASTIMIIAFLLLLIFKIIYDSILGIGFMYLLPNFLISATFFILSTYLLTHPNILLGFPFIKYKEIKSELFKNDAFKLAVIEEDYSEQIDTLNQYITSKNAYLTKGLNISDVAVNTGIPVKQLSFIINNHFNLRFNDFINKYRIEYINEKINNGYLDTYTLKTLYGEAGFTSQNTFINAFKKINKASPSEYIARSSK